MQAARRHNRVGEIVELAHPIGAPQARAGQGEPHPALAGQPRQVPATADVWKEADPGLVARTAALAEKTTPSASPGFASDSGTLGGIETDLESADLPPTESQRQTVAGSTGRIDTLWTDWTSLRDGDLAALDTALAAAGEQRVVIPPPDRLIVVPPAGGEDLP